MFEQKDLVCGSGLFALSRNKVLLKRKRVGIRPEGRAPAREGSVIINEQGRAIGIVTSGGFGPTVNGPVAMGYVESAYAGVGTRVNLVVRDKPMPALVAALPFTPHKYKR